MGWCSGSYMAEDLWKRIKPLVPAKNRQKVAAAIVDEFEKSDADDWSYEKGGVYQTGRPDEVAAHEREMDEEEKRHERGEDA